MVIQNDIATIENNLVVPQEVKDTIWPKKSRDIPKKIENICSYKTLYVNVHCNVIHNSQKWKQLKYPLSDERLNKCGQSMQK